MDKGALFSDDRTYRYVLWRTWDSDLPHVTFIGLNPSTADEVEDDPTIRRCINFAKYWGDYGGIYMLNLFAFRATNPKEMKKTRLPIGHDNLNYMLYYFSRSALIIPAWGNNGTHRNEDKKLMDIIKSSRVFSKKTYCLGTNKTGTPKHPLYVKGDTSLIPFTN